jgi:hypothetical protein
MFSDTWPNIPFGLTAVSKRANKPGYGKLYVFDFAEVTTNRLEDKSDPGSVTFSTDGAASMTSRVKGFVAKVRKVNPNIRCDHCLIHREAVVAKSLPSSLKVVLDEVAKVVKLIKSRPLNSRLLSMLCQELESDNTTLLLHTKVR